MRLLSRARESHTPYASTTLATNSDHNDVFRDGGLNDGEHLPHGVHASLTKFVTCQH